MSPLTLTRDEASAICSELTWTCSDSREFISWDISDGLDARTPAELEATLDKLEDAARRLRLEAAIRDDGGWWDHGRSPNYLDLKARHGDGECPDTFRLTDAGAAALREFCADRMSEFIADAEEGLAASMDNAADREDHERRKAALISLAERLGVELSEATA